MKVLILGGTVFLGRHLVQAALQNGHEVSIFTRGASAPKGTFEGVEHLIGNRDGDLQALLGRTWDAVIDTSGFLPRIVSQSAQALKDSVSQYIFISTLSVYKDMSSIGADETSELLELEDETSEDIAKYYGELKTACERVIQKTYGDRALIVRPGLIVGPYDKTDRFTYWPVRVAKGGQVLAPGTPERRLQVIHGADLAEWTIHMMESRAHGVFNATGPSLPLTMGEFLEACKRVSGSDAEFVWVEDEFLTDQGVGEWMELPLWIADPSMKAMMYTNIDKALHSGLRFRGIEETIQDTLDWNATRSPDVVWKAGLDAEKEARVLAAWQTRK